MLGQRSLSGAVPAIQRGASCRASSNSEISNVSAYLDFHGRSTCAD